MKILNFFEMDNTHSNDKIKFTINEEDKYVLYKFIEDVGKEISQKILKEKEEKDVLKFTYSKEQKYRNYHKALKDIRNKLEDLCLCYSDTITLSYYEFNFLYYALLYEYENIFDKIDKEGTDIIDINMAKKIKYFEQNNESYHAIVKDIESKLYPNDTIFYDCLGEILWLIEDDGFPDYDNIDFEDKFINIFIADYEKCTIIENLIFFKELIDTKPSDKVYGALDFYINENIRIQIDKQTQINFINSFLKNIEQFKQGDVKFKISISEFLLYYVLCNSFYERLMKKCQVDYNEDYSIQQKCIFESLKDVRKYIQYRPDIFNIRDREFNRYF